MDNYHFFELKNKNDGFFDGYPSFFLSSFSENKCGKLTVFLFLSLAFSSILCYIQISLFYNKHKM